MAEVSSDVVGSRSAVTGLISADDWGAAACAPHAGNGTLARVGQILLLVATADDASVAPLLDHVEMVAANGSDGRQLVRGFALQLVSMAGDPPSFVALAPVATGLAVFAAGAASVMVDGQEVTGRNALAWAERLFPWPVTEVTGWVGDAESPTSGLLDLRQGIVRAGGFTVRDEARRPTMTPRPTPDPTGPSEPPARPPEPVVADRLPAQPAPPQFESVVLGLRHAVDPDDVPSPLPIVSRRRDIPAPSIAVSQVRGVFCKNHHFNDPRVLFCAVCGINMVQQTPILVDGKRPPLGVLVLDDGSVFQLDTNYLLGRDPESDELVRNGRYRSIQVSDNQNMISRVHARLELRHWDAVLVDNASTNGTFFAEPGWPAWKQLPKSGDQLLTPGTRIRIGHRTLAFNTYRGN